MLGLAWTFATSKIGGYVLAALAAVAIAVGAYWYVYHRGQTDERNSNAVKTMQETEEQRRLREDNDAKARGRTDDDALKCLRSPTGC